MPKVSIITVCKNEVDGIRRTLESVVSQTFREFEYIVIDGGSTDGTLETIREFEPGIAHLVSEPDAGIYSAQNKGVLAASGDYLLFINGGDALHDNAVLEDIFSNDLSEDILYGNLLIEEQDGTETVGYTPPEITLDFLLRGTLWHPVTFIRRQLFETYGLYDENLQIVADYDFFVKVILVEEVSTRHFSRLVARFNTDGIGSSAQWNDIHELERVAVQGKYFSKYVLQMFDEFERYRIQNEVLRRKVELLEIEETQEKNYSVLGSIRNMLGKNTK